MPSRPASRKYAVPPGPLRERVALALRAQGEHSERAEQSCAYRLDFAAGGAAGTNERVVAKQYTNGTLFLQSAGTAGPLFERLAAAVESLVGAPVAAAAPAAPGQHRGPRGRSEDVDVARPFETPWIGTDEAGKGDYFGPLVAAAVYVDERRLGLLETLGVRDSKLLSAAQIRRLAQEVRAVAGEGFAEVVVPPERYNALYEQFHGEGKNLNALLAWAHVRAIQAVVEAVPCQNVIVDQFADARYVRSRLEANPHTRHMNVVQLPHAEANAAVAAASVLARDRFVKWFEYASREAGFTLPKGASSQVDVVARKLVAAHGPEALRRFAKLHFKTTARVLPSVAGSSSTAK